MSVKILDKANSCQVDKFGPWHLLPAMGQVLQAESNTVFPTAPCRHIWGLLGRIPQWVFLPLCPFPPAPGLPRGVVVSVRRAVEGWVCAEVSNCCATALTAPAPRLPPPWGPAGWKATKLPSLSSTLWAVWINLFLVIYFILVKHLHHFVIVNLSDTFLPECGVGRKSKPIRDGPQQDVRLGAWERSNTAVCFQFHSLKAKAGNDCAT